MLHCSVTTKQISVSEFKAHCAEELRSVESGDTQLEITRHGKIIAIVEHPQAATSEEAPTIAEMMGSLRGSVTFADDDAPDEPSFAPEDWEDHPVNTADS